MSLSFLLFVHIMLRVKSTASLRGGQSPTWQSVPFARCFCLSQGNCPTWSAGSVTPPYRGASCRPQIIRRPGFGGQFAPSGLPIC